MTHLSCPIRLLLQESWRSSEMKSAKALTIRVSWPPHTPVQKSWSKRPLNGKSTCYLRTCVCVCVRVPTICVYLLCVLWVMYPCFLCCNIPSCYIINKQVNSWWKVSVFIWFVVCCDYVTVCVSVSDSLLGVLKRPRVNHRLEWKTNSVCWGSEAASVESRSLIFQLNM